jgi:hypothetical protein
MDKIFIKYQPEERARNEAQAEVQRLTNLEITRQQNLENK